MDTSLHNSLRYRCISWSVLSSNCRRLLGGVITYHFTHNVAILVVDARCTSWSVLSSITITITNGSPASYISYELIGSDELSTAIVRYPSPLTCFKCP